MAVMKEPYVKKKGKDLDMPYKHQLNLYDASAFSKTFKSTERFST